MIEERASVVEAGSERVLLRVSGEEACESCDMAEQCYRDGGLLSIPTNKLRGLSPRELVPGKTVKLTMERASLLGLSGLVYGIPLGLFIAGLLGGYFLILPDAGEAMRALGSFAVGVLLIAFFRSVIVRMDRRASRRLKYRTETVEQGETGTEYYERMYTGE